MGENSIMQATEIKGSIEIKNQNLLNWIQEVADLVQPDEIEVVDVQKDKDRLIKESIAAGEMFELADGNYYARSHRHDVARSVPRTYVATEDSNDKGLYNNWQLASEIRPKVIAKLKGSMKGQKMYVIPYLMGPVGEFAQAGVQLSNSRYVAINKMVMSKVGQVALDAIGTSDRYVRGIHCTGNLDTIKRASKDEDPYDDRYDERYFISFPDDREIISYGSGYGGNALLGKKFHSLRQASYDARKEGWLAEHMLILGVTDKKTGETRYVTGAFPSASGKTNLAMMKPPASLADRYELTVVGDDIAWLRIGEDGRLWAVNPENGFFGVVPGTNEKTNPYAMAAIGEGTKSIFTNVAFNPKTRQIWWEGKTKEPPTDEGWLDWKGDPWTPEKGIPAAHPNSRVTASIDNAPNVSPHWQDSKGVPVSVILFGGRVPKGEPLIRELPDVESGIYDGAVMGVQTTAAEVGSVGKFREDPMAMLPFMSYHEGDYLAHWLKVFAKAGEKAPKFFHINWFRLDDNGKFIWPGFGENLRAILWALDRAEGKTGTGAKETPIGSIPNREDLNLEGLDMSPEDLNSILDYDEDYWKKDMERRTQHLAKFGSRLPQEIREVHLNLVEKIAGPDARKKAEEDLNKTARS